MPKIAVLLFIWTSALLAAGTALRCRKCNGCETTSAQQETCRNDIDADREVAACLTQVIRDFGSKNPFMTIKKCVVYDKSTKYECQKIPGSDPMSCNICFEDYCNVAPSDDRNLKLAAILGFVSLLLML